MTVATFKSVPDMKAKVTASGSYFFERQTMEFFHSKIESPLIHGTYFVTSEYPDDPAGKRYTARYFEVTPAGNMDHREIGEFMAYESVAEAKGAIFRHLENQRKRKEFADALYRWTQLKVGDDPNGNGRAFFRPDGEYLLGEILEDGSGVELIEGNRVTRMLVADYTMPHRFYEAVGAVVNAKIADWLADE